MRTRLLYFLFIGMLFSSCAKDIGYISGNVEFKRGQSDIVHASYCQVTILPGGESVTADYYGNFISPPLLPGEYTLTFSYSGIFGTAKDRSIKVTVIGGSVVVIETIFL